MNKSELKGLLKGIGIAMVVCATIFYSLILNYRAEMAFEKFQNEEEVISAARDLGMVFLSDIDQEDASEINGETELEEPTE